MDLGESLGQAAVRETVEETGIKVKLIRVTGIYTNPKHVLIRVTGIYTNPKHVLEYTSNGEVRQEFSVVFIAERLSGEPRPSSESTRVECVPAHDIANLPMHPSMRMRVEHALTGRRDVYFDSAAASHSSTCATIRRSSGCA